MQPARVMNCHFILVKLAKRKVSIDWPLGGKETIGIFTSIFCCQVLESLLSAHETASQNWKYLYPAIQQSLHPGESRPQQKTIPIYEEVM